jgi:hypothetical protein
MITSGDVRCQWSFVRGVACMMDSSMADGTDLARLKLSVQRALLGAVDQRMFAVTVEMQDQTIMLRSYVIGQVTPDDLEQIQIVGTEVIADFDSPWQIDEYCLTWEGCPLNLEGRLVFLRAP